MVSRIFRYKKENRVALYRNIHSGSFICTYTDLFPSTNRVISFRNILISFLFFFFVLFSGTPPKIHHSPLRTRAFKTYACTHARTRFVLHIVDFRRKMNTCFSQDRAAPTSSSGKSRGKRRTGIDSLCGQLGYMQIKLPLFKTIATISTRLLLDVQPLEL